MDNNDVNDSTGSDTTTNDSTDDAQLQLRRDAELAAHIMLENEGARMAKLSDKDRMLVAAGLAEKLERASHEQNLDVAELRHKLELSREEKREGAYEM
ncbi:hypothetical protein EOL70_26290 [Leucothrix sargassi]|nr:hypothetical protein EOL70_26290 [Leucothrix sargassi]